MKMMNWIWVVALAVVVGCGEAPTAEGPDAAEVAAASALYVAEAEPEGAVGVGEARESVESEQAVTLVGTIGGSRKPFVEGMAAFTIVDPKVPFCSADEGCPTPWDYCCTQPQVKENIATVKVVDADGGPVSYDARKLLNVKELSTVVVQGTAKRDDQGNLTVAANKVFVRSE
ncbi:hypothetical protein EC9_24460 [Rosistilla ulvae]|uniref:Uncharacterized protein n=1 Tax=Rosistilla ulvae TaxID=1930277 RepID=A0A517M059_9BACT|nr:hypothetical protein [Rosistilla ulvae]QDS88256.1 hypothetical protein EC9_24460 [Rosistilla ulvae]